MNRKMRRAGEAIHKKNVKAAINSNEWTPFEDRTAEARPRYPLNNLISFHGNNLYSVQVLQVEGKIVAGIRRHDQSTNVSWATKQRIKNEIFGEEVSMIEVFPKQSELVDDANMYWLWVFDNWEFDLKMMRVK